MIPVVLGVFQFVSPHLSCHLCDVADIPDDLWSLNPGNYHPFCTSEATPFPWQLRSQGSKMVALVRLRNQFQAIRSQRLEPARKLLADCDRDSMPIAAGTGFNYASVKRQEA